MAIVKCAVCGKQFNREKEKTVKYGARRYAHFNCAPDNEIVFDPSNDSKLVLEDYIMKLFQFEEMPQKVKKTITRMIKEYGYTYDGILGSLIYFYEIKGNTTEKSNNNVGIVPWIYDEAREYYAGIDAAIAVNEDKDLDAWNIETRVVEIPPPNPHTKKTELLDLERLLDE